MTDDEQIDQMMYDAETAERSKEKEMNDRKETFTECTCGCQVIQYVWVFTENGGEYRRWQCTRCGRPRKS